MTTISRCAGRIARPRMSQVPPQGHPGAPGRILPYPTDAEPPPPPPAFAPPPGRPPYRHQLDQQAPAATRDPDEVRPPGAIGTAPSAAPQAAPGAAPQPGRHAGTAALPPKIA